MHTQTRPHISFFKCSLLGFLSLLCLVSMTATLHASESGSQEDALIQSMQERLPALMELKLAGKVGETNLGLVEARAVLEREDRHLLSDENRDRLAHYKMIADKLGVPIGAVQRKRAEQIAEKSPRNIWIQSKSGVWYRE